MSLSAANRAYRQCRREPEFYQRAMQNMVSGETINLDFGKASQYQRELAELYRDARSWIGRLDRIIARSRSKEDRRERQEARELLRSFQSLSQEFRAISKKIDVTVDAFQDADRRIFNNSQRLTDGLYGIGSASGLIVGKAGRMKLQPIVNRYRNINDNPSTGKMTMEELKILIEDMDAPKDQKKAALIETGYAPELVDLILIGGISISEVIPNRNVNEDPWIGGRLIAQQVLVDPNKTADEKIQALIDAGYLKENAISIVTKATEAIAANAVDFYDYGDWNHSQAFLNGGHLGVDLSHGSDIKSIADGVVVHVKSDEIDHVAGVSRGSGNGNIVIVKHTIDGVDYFTSYSHMKFDSATVAIGDPVKAGTSLGTEGNSGNSGGSHVHINTYVYVEGEESKKPPGYTTDSVAGSTTHTSEDGKTYIDYQDGHGRTYRMYDYGDVVESGGQIIVETNS